MIPFIVIELDRPRKLRFGMGAMIEFEQLTKKKITELTDDDMSGELLANILWIMLRQEQPELTLKQVCDIVDDYADNMTDVVSKVTEAINAAFASKSESKNAKATARKNI